jgi:methyltransferase
MRWVAVTVVVGVVVQRLLELRVSARNEARIRAAGGAEADAETYPVMRLVHAGMLGGALVESAVRQPPSLGSRLPWALLLAVAAVVRIWALSTLGNRWNVLALAEPGQRITRQGPYRWIRHPNYLAVILEMAAVPMIANAPSTAVVASAANAWILSRRIPAEERLLAGQSDYDRQFAGVARFIPGVL